MFSTTESELVINQFKCSVLESVPLTTSSFSSNNANSLASLFQAIVYLDVNGFNLSTLIPCSATIWIASEAVAGLAPVSDSFVFKIVLSWETKALSPETFAFLVNPK